MVIELNDKEKEVLKLALDSYEKGLRGEIVKTDDRELKAILHGEDDLIKGLISKLA